MLQGQFPVEHYKWVPTFGIDFDFYLDGLALLFCLLITGVGSLVFLYSSYYLKGHRYLARFYAYLGMFMTAMLGLVLSNNIILLFVFWELTSITSFFLIGFDNENEKAQKSAMMALAITGGGGLVLLGGLIVMSNIAETFSIQAMALSATQLKDHAWYGFLLLSFFTGAFTKSAQFPFHFWLPKAMTAPTPVSAYLHSATMVKAGIYLIARFTPILGEMPLWNNTLMIVGGITMLFAAFYSIFHSDMKSVLAYSTIAALGIIIFLLGIGTKEALFAASVFIVVHALYKATLFLMAGTIDHETGTRDLTLLSGLGYKMKPLAVAGILAALSSAGIPFLYGFIGKELIYESTTEHWNSQGIVLTLVAVISNIFIAYAGFVVGIKPYLGKVHESLSEVKLPNWRLWLPPLILSILALALGIFPSVTSRFMGSVSSAIGGEQLQLQLKIWHGFGLVFYLSLATIALAVMLFFVKKVRSDLPLSFALLESISPLAIYEKTRKLLVRISVRYTRFMHNGYLRNYMLTIVGFTVAILAYKLTFGPPLQIDWDNLSPIRFYEVVLAVVMFGGILLSSVAQSRLTALIGLGVVGYAISILYVLYGAPDLAMTQFAIDTLTVVLFVLVLFKLPPFLNFANTRIKIRDGIVSSAFGLLIGLIALSVYAEPAKKEVSEFYADNAYSLAKGRNVVNVILVDFRAMDTLFEIVVLAMASIGVYSLLKLKVKKSERE